MQAVAVPPSWDTARKLILSELAERNACVVALGPRGIGKSTFCRYIIRQSGSKEIDTTWHELDPGQPAWCVSGLMYSSPNKLAERVDRLPDTNICTMNAITLFYGFNSPRGNPERYVACSRKLLSPLSNSSFEKQVPSVLSTQRFKLDVINTCGWVQGLGLSCTINSILPTLAEISSQPSGACAVVCFFPGAEHVVQRLQNSIPTTSNVTFVSLSAAVSSESGSNALSAGPSKALGQGGATLALDQQAHPRAQHDQEDSTSVRQRLVLLSSTDGDPSLAQTDAAIPDELKRGGAAGTPTTTDGGQGGRKRTRSSEDPKSGRLSAALRLWQQPEASSRLADLQVTAPGVSAVQSRGRRGLAVVFGCATAPVNDAGVTISAGNSVKPAFRSPALSLLGGSLQQALQHGHRYHQQTSADGTQTKAAAFSSWLMSDAVMAPPAMPGGAQSAEPLHAAGPATGQQAWVPLKNLTVYDGLNRVKVAKDALRLVSSVALGRAVTLLDISLPSRPADDSSVAITAAHFPDTLPVESSVISPCILAAVLDTPRCGHVLALRLNSASVSSISMANAIVVCQAPDFPTTVTAAPVDSLPPRGSNAAKHQHLPLGAVGLESFHSPLGHIQL